MKMQCETMDLLGLSFSACAAARSGLLGCLADQKPHRPEELAGLLELDPRATTRVLDVLVALGLAWRQDEAYGGTRELAELIRLLPAGLEANLALWGHTESYLRSGEPLVAMDSSLETQAAAYRSAVGDLGRLFGSAARILARSLPVAPTRILDVGCGSGIWSLTVAERFPQARVVGNDLPSVLDVFEAQAAAMGMRERCERLEQDMHQARFEDSSFDLAIIANVLRLEPADRAARLLQRVAASLRPGGALLVVDALAEGSPKAELARSLYTLHLALRTRNGVVHPSEQVRAWMQSAGLGQVSRLDFGNHPGALGALLGVRGQPALPGPPEVLGARPGMG
ncbi:class I SAM-dependent methyltransferase [bacterium CPR1]|nr:class I SAM-dependent methyltransferase [bacterium CPR1]